MKEYLTERLAKLGAELLRQIATAKPVFDSIDTILAEMRTLTRLLSEMEWKESHE